MLYNVHGTNGRIKQAATLGEALRKASRLVYLSDSQRERVVEQVRREGIAGYSYGFAECWIISEDYQ
jgi:hypothetical protein